MRLPMKEVIYSFCKEHESKMRIQPGEEVVIEADDCFRGQIRTEEENIEGVDWNYINPATGPIFIESAEAGDILKVEIKDIQIAGQAVMVTAPGEGLLGDRLKDSTTRIFTVEDNKLIFNQNIALPVDPMIGVIGTAPEGEAISTGSPGIHGGNMDCKLVTAGSIIYLPVAVKGGLLSVGDLHSLMGDGEIVFCGAETRGVVTLKIDLMKGVNLPLPMLENDDKLISIASGRTLDQAVKVASNNMTDFLMKYCEFNMVEAGMLQSLAGDARICQVVDPLKTARFEMPKRILGIKDLEEVIEG